MELRTAESVDDTFSFAQFVTISEASFTIQVVV